MLFSYFSYQLYLSWPLGERPDVTVRGRCPLEFFHLFGRLQSDGRFSVEFSLIGNSDQISEHSPCSHRPSLPHAPKDIHDTTLDAAGAGNGHGETGGRSARVICRSDKMKGQANQGEVTPPTERVCNSSRKLERVNLYR
jgi:hypothetical protein